MNNSKSSTEGNRNIAIRYGAAIVDADGHVSGHDAGATLVRRLLRVFPGARLIGTGPRQGEGFDVIPLEFVDGVGHRGDQHGRHRLRRGLADAQGSTVTSRS